MDKPAQNQTISHNLRDLIEQDQKPILKLRVLALSWRISSWHHDAKTCIKIWHRLVSGNAYSPRIEPLVWRWAGILLEYGRVYSIPAGEFYLLGDKPEWQSGSVWLINYLEEIVKYKKDVFNFNVKTWQKEPGQCYVLKTECPNIVYYQYNDLSGNTYDSEGIGSNTLKYLRTRIQAGINRHRSIKVRQELQSEIRRKYERNRKLRAKRDQIYGGGN